MRVLRRSLSVVTFAGFIAMLWSNAVPAAVSYTTVGGNYSQNFDSLPNTPTNVNLQTQTTPKSWIDDTAVPTINQISLEGWYLWHPLTDAEGGTNSHQRFRISSGNSATGSFYSFGTNSTTDRALGMISSNTLAAANAESYIGLRLTNNTGSTLGQFTLSYNGEQWRDGGNSPAVAQNLKFGYKVAAANVQDTGFTLVPALQFTSPVFATTAAAVDGNVAGHVAVAATTVSGFNWAPGTDLWLRWVDINDPNNDHGLAIDDISFSANIIPTSTWNGTTNSDWNNASNWTGGVPGSGNIANFDNGGNGNTSISLGGTKPIGYIQFNAGAAAYTLGSSSEQFDVDAGGSITVASGVTNSQTINAKINALGGLTVTNSSTTAGLTLGANLTSGGAVAMASEGTLNVNGAVSNNSGVAVSGAGTATLNGVISGSGSVTSTMTGTFVTNAQHTFGGGANITVTTSTQPVVRIGASTVGAPGSVTAGPFGTGTLTISGATSPILQPTGGDITIANTVSLPAGFFAATAPAAVDATPRSLTFTGPITTVGARTITNNIVSGGTLTLGSAGSPSTLTLGGNLGLQTQSATSGPGGGIIVVNDQISGAGGINAQNGATVYITNNNTNTLESNVQNSASGQAITTTLIVNNVPVNPTDAGLAGGVAVRTGTLAGTGTIAGTARMLESSNGPAHLAPGNGAGTANGAGKLTFYNDLTFSPATTPCATCTFDVEIGGLTAGTQYDQVVVGGALTLGDTTPRGTLNVSLINGFTTPTSSTDFTIMTGSSVTGTFAAVNLPDANWSIVYNATSVVLHVAGGGLSGDFNNDGTVDAADYVIWRKGGSPNPNSQTDYDAWRTNFGKPPGAGSGSAIGSGTVPEPTTMLMLLMGTLAILGVRRKR